MAKALETEFWTLKWSSRSLCDFFSRKITTVIYLNIKLVIELWSFKKMAKALEFRTSKLAQASLLFFFLAKLQQ